MFYTVPPEPEVVEQIMQQAGEEIEAMHKEMQVKLKEQEVAMQEAVKSGQMLPERYKLEMEKAQKMMDEQLKVAQQEVQAQLMAEASKVENSVVSEKEFKIMQEDKVFAEMIVDAIKYIKQE